MEKKFLSIVIMLVLISSIVVGSAMFLFPYNPNNPPKANNTGSTEAGIQEVVNSNNKFALDFYSKLEESVEGNIFYSPYSIYSALAMTYEGAKGQTANEIRNVFHFPNTETLRPNFAAIYNDINRGNNEYELRTGNALWVQEDYPFLQDYLKRVENYYGGKASNLDFINETEESRKTINKFIEEQTNKKIKDLIPSGTLNPLTRMVLTNAIYFKGTWEWEFEKSNTRERNFKISPDKTIKVPMMYMDPEKARFNYTDLGEIQILELPYKGDEISMLIMLPNETLDSVEPITMEKLEEWRSGMRETKLDAIYIPKFEFDTKYFLSDVLSDMGMSTAFRWPGANFSRMDGTDMLYISSVIHQAYVKVDEEGTEAAAATAVVMTAGSASPRNVFRADHPFVFIIQEKGTGNILFLGRIVNPTAE